MSRAFRPVDPTEGNQVGGNQMPPARGNGVSEMSQRPLRPGLHLKTASSEPDGVQSTNKHSVDRSPRVSDRRSPRTSATDKKKAVGNSTLQKKRNNQISDLEMQLGLAQDEVKKLKDQLTYAENAKKEAELKLKETKKQISPISDSVPDDIQEPNKTEILDEASEIPPGKEKTCPVKENDNAIKDNLELLDADYTINIDETKKENNERTDTLIAEKAEQPLEKSESWFTEIAESVNIEVKAKVLQKQQELIRLSAENEGLKLQLLEMEELKTKEKESTKKLSQVTEELEESKQITSRVTEELKVVIQAKANLEAEMKRLRVQTEQWRKAAEAATSILASIDNSGGTDMNCQYGNKQHHAFDKSGYIGLDSPLCDITEDGYAGKHKVGSVGTKMFGDLWKKKGQKE